MKIEIYNGLNDYDLELFEIEKINEEELVKLFEENSLVAFNNDREFASDIAHKYKEAVGIISYENNFTEVKIRLVKDNEDWYKVCYKL